MKHRIISTAVALAAFAATFGVGLLLVRPANETTLETPSTTPNLEAITVDLGPEDAVEPNDGPAADPATSTTTTTAVTTTVPVVTTTTTAGSQDGQNTVTPTTTVAQRPTTTVAPRPTTTVAQRPFPGNDFPTVNPLRIDGAVDTFYIADNYSQASAWGLDPGDVRTWGMLMTPSQDPREDHKRILAALKAAGVTVIVDTMQYDPGQTVGSFTGKYQKWTLELIVLGRQHVTVHLMNW